MNFVCVGDGHPFARLDGAERSVDPNAKSEAELASEVCRGTRDGQCADAEDAGGNAVSATSLHQ
jgi:hypothetical protein